MFVKSISKFLFVRNLNIKVSKMKNTTNIDLLSKQECQQFFASFDNVLTDCDGVLWMLNQVIHGAPDVMNGFKANGKKVFYVTNNSTKTQTQLLEKFKNLGFEASRNEIISTSFLAAKYLKTHLDPSKRVYVVGSPAIASELNEVGVKHFGVGPDYLQSSVPEFVENVQLEENVGAVLVGFDEHFSYPKIFKAASYLKDQSCLFVATNTDESFPVSGTKFIMPGTGSLVCTVKTCAGREPFVVGKPYSFIRQVLMDTYNIDPNRTIMIGDRCNTDILLGKRCGFKTLMVLTGVNTFEEINNWSKSDDPELQDLVPDYFAKSISSLKATFPVPL